MDLVYLREDNKKFGDILRPEDEKKYRKLLRKYGIEGFKGTYKEETEKMFANVEQIVNDLGATLRGVHFEILLHDVRNPLRSIRAAQNSESVSGRRVGDPSTRFVVEYVKYRGEHLSAAFRTGSKVAYVKQFKKDKEVKATTIPLYDRRLGLVGILCINIDIESVATLGDSERRQFFEDYVEALGFCLTRQKAPNLYI